jgi:hypothetical protein
MRHRGIRRGNHAQCRSRVYIAGVSGFLGVLKRLKKGVWSLDGGGNQVRPLIGGIFATCRRNSTAFRSDSEGGGGLGATKGNPMRPRAGGMRTRGFCCPHPPHTGGGEGAFIFWVWGLESAAFKWAFRSRSRRIQSSQGSLCAILCSLHVHSPVNVVPHRGVVLSQF